MGETDNWIQAHCFAEIAKKSHHILIIDHIIIIEISVWIVGQH
jgi:hypothetical protein